MQILFLWIEGFRKIKRQGLNFSGQLNFHYDPKDNTLSIVENENYIEDYYGKSIKDITAIVGENGTGKTSILDFVKDRIGSERPIRNKLIVVYAPDNTKNCKVLINNVDDSFKINREKVSKKIKISIQNLKGEDGLYTEIPSAKSWLASSYSYEIHQNIYGSSRIKHRKKVPSFLELIPDFSKSIIVFYSNIFDYRVEQSSSFVYNLSTNFLELARGNKIRIYEIKSQVEFVVLNSHANNLDISLPDYIKIRFRARTLRGNYKDRFDEDRLEGMRIRYLIDYFANEIDRIIKKDNYTDKRRDPIRVCSALLHNYCIEICGNEKSLYLKNFFVDSIISLEKTQNIDLNFFNYFASQLTDIVNGEVVLGDKLAIELNKELAINLKKVFRFVFDFNLERIPKTNVYTTDLAVGNEEAGATKDFIETYLNSFIENSPVEIDWQDMSSGEKARLAFLARINSLKSDKLFARYGKGKDIILLIDEGEQYFHPQWQKEYISFLVYNLPKIFPNNKFQIILTSHSPFVLSDMFRENVMYLTRNPKNKFTIIVDSSTKERTLAANIHTLFTDAYFMKEGLLGSYVQDRMRDILTPLVKKTMTKDQSSLIFKFISSIGEPLLRNRLLVMFESATKN